MKFFFLKVSLLVIPICLILFICLFVPANSFLRRDFLFSQIDKNLLLKTVKEPRVILIGGSNLTFGMDSQLIKDSLQLNPINTALHANLGLKYMLKNTEQYINKGDIIIVSPEYHQFYNHKSDGELELLTVLFDVSPETKNLLDSRQCFTILKYIPTYIGSKLNPLNYLRKVGSEIRPYDRKAINNYGDAYKHWSLPARVFPKISLDGDLDEQAFQALIDFNSKITLKGAKLFISFPAYKDDSFDLSKDKIKIIQQKLLQEKFNILGTPEEYRFKGNMFFDTPYHLNKSGAQYRTRLMIHDLGVKLK